MKKRIIIIVVVILIISLIASWIIITGGELKTLKAVSEDWEATITVIEDHLEGYPNNTKETVYNLQGKDVIALKELIQQKTVCRRRIEQGGFSSLNTDDKKRILIIIQDNKDKDFSLQLVNNKMVLISDILNNHLKNLNNDYESEILMFLSSYDPVKEEIY